MPGLGLGLSVSRAVAHAHGGTIDIVSEPGSGAVVTLTLPVDGRRGHSHGLTLPARQPLVVYSLRAPAPREGPSARTPYRPLAIAGEGPFFGTQLWATTLSSTTADSIVVAATSRSGT
ncbi:hypothetical protein GCM10009862_22080 [Microbacterium binotii]|uniref:histidine kinase n=1 Tax=Microbacterium binotii TaxID=462710 RepID=A0ABN3PH34_9MICO